MAKRISNHLICLSVVLAFAAALAACGNSPASYDYHGAPPEIGEGDGWVSPDNPPTPPTDVTPEPDTGTGTDLTDADTPKPGDTVEPGDAPGVDAGPDIIADVQQPPECGEVLFSYVAAAGVQEVLVSGGFNGWGDSAATATPMADEDGDGVWEAQLVLEPGTYQYKFIVDGVWTVDPSNPNRTDDNEGGFNNVLVVDECDGPGDIYLQSHDTDQNTGGFTATFVAAGGGLEEGQISVTVDWKAAPAGTVDVAGDGASFDVKLDGLDDGIYDVRVTVGEEEFLLKVYVGVSTDWRDAVLYFVFTDRFSDGDPSINAPLDDVDWRTNYQGGDFQGVIDRIEDGYFDDLGVGALWLSWPVDNPDFFEEGGHVDDVGCELDPKTANYSGMRYTGFHGYWPSDLYETEEHFGSMDKLQELVSTAHAHGIRVLLDFTANHVHDSSPFYTEHKDDGFFHFPIEICQNVGWDVKPVTCWFTDYLPDLNYSNPAAVTAVLDYAMWWATQSGCDGFRLDAVKHIEFEFIKKLRTRVHDVMELTGVDFYIVGETFTEDAGLIEDFIGSDKIHGQFDFPSNKSILKSFATQEMGLADMDQAVRQAKAVYGDQALMSNFVGNHDIVRFISMAAGMINCGIWDVVSNIAQGWKSPPGQPGDSTPYLKLRLAFTYIMTIPGVPLIYYGDEFGLPGAGDPDNRRVMRFGGELTGHEPATLSYMQKLGGARKAHPALSKGTWTAPLWAEWDFLAYARVLPEETAVVLINIGGGEKAGELDVGPAGLADGAQLDEVLAGGSAGVSAGKMPFSLPAMTAAIYVTK